MTGIRANAWVDQSTQLAAKSWSVHSLIASNDAELLRCDFGGALDRLGRGFCWGSRGGGLNQPVGPDEALQNVNPDVNRGQSPSPGLSKTRAPPMMSALSMRPIRTGMQGGAPPRAEIPTRKYISG